MAAAVDAVAEDLANATVSEPADAEAAAAAAKEAKRAEIMANLAKARADQEQKIKEAAQKTEYFGEHNGITCDGCGGPVVGYRYKCKNCQNHDTCEACYDIFKNEGRITNGLSEQRLSSDPKDHSFKLHKDSNFKPMVKGAGGVTKKKEDKKPKPNEPCPCGSGKKYKKCCGK
mmetsp:Transcript_51805/g.144644  ORF Transcript_51805/g.144644 Transcript_51805/m.144644 type:complete len:173 (-) Transcript_51805:154-672(-)